MSEGLALPKRKAHMPAVLAASVFAFVLLAVSFSLLGGATPDQDHHPATQLLIDEDGQCWYLAPICSHLLNVVSTSSLDDVDMLTIPAMNLQAVSTDDVVAPAENVLVPLAPPPRSS